MVVTTHTKSGSEQSSWGSLYQKSQSQTATHKGVPREHHMCHGQVTWLSMMTFCIFRYVWSFFIYIYIYIRRVVNYSWYLLSHFLLKFKKHYIYLYIYVLCIYVYNCVYIYICHISIYILCIYIYIYICHILTFLIVKVKSPHFRKPRDAGAEDKVGLTQFHSPGFCQGLEFEQCMLYRIIAQ